MWVYRNFAHYLVGIIIALSSLVNWVLPLCGLALFLVYEVDEDYHISDQAFRDILEAAIGFFTTTGGLIIWRLLL